jgi:hypothetical protein
VFEGRGTASVFGSVLDRDAGRFRVNPAGVYVPAARRYIPGTLVTETSWWAPGGWLVVTDTLLQLIIALRPTTKQPMSSFG